MIKFSEESVESSDGTTIGYLVGGEGSPLILVHGAFTVADEWLDSAKILAENHTVYIIERRGRGRSGDTEEHTFQQEIDDLKALIEQVNGAKTIVGHSFGAAVSLGYAIRNNFDGELVLYEPPISFDGLVGGALLPELERLITEKKLDEALEYAYTHITKTSKQDIEIFRSSPVWLHHRGLLGQTLRETKSLDDSTPTIADCLGLKCRSTLLLGSETGPDMTKMAAGLLERISGLTVIPLLGQGHVCHLLDAKFMAKSIEVALALPKLVENGTFQ